MMVVFQHIFPINIPISAHIAIRTDSGLGRGRENKVLDGAKHVTCEDGEHADWWFFLDGKITLTWVLFSTPRTPVPPIGGVPREPFSFREGWRLGLGWTPPPPILKQKPDGFSIPLFAKNY